MIPPHLPSATDLGAEFEKLDADPGSCIVIEIRKAEKECNFGKVTWAWISKEERAALRSALLKCRRKRESRAAIGANSGFNAVIET